MMKSKLLTDRQQIAQALNFNRYPVLRIDLSDTDDYGLKGCNVRIDAGTFRDGSPYIIKATLRAYSDEKRLTTSSAGAYLSADFSYYDYRDMAENAMAPLIHPDEDVAIAVYDSKTCRCFPVIIAHTAKHVSRGCTCPISFEPSVDVSPLFDIIELIRRESAQKEE